jgi:acyl carrier protein
MTVVPAPTVTFETVAARLGNRLSVPPASLTPRTALADLAGDSLDLVEMLIDLQEEFGVSLTQADLRTVLTLGDLVALLGPQSHAAPH